jgi:hypothetical protein
VTETPTETLEPAIVGLFPYLLIAGRMQIGPYELISKAALTEGDFLAPWIDEQTRQLLRMYELRGSMGNRFGTVVRRSDSNRCRHLHWPRRGRLKWPHLPSFFCCCFYIGSSVRVRSARLSWAAFALGESVFEAPGLAAGVDDVGAVGEAVDDGFGEPGVGEDFRPFTERQVGGDDH